MGRATGIEINPETARTNSEPLPRSQNIKQNRSRCLFDNFEKIVEDDARWAYRFQRKFSEKLKDRDDIYLEVKTSEERRKRKGFSPRVLILPGWDMSDEDSYDEGQARRRTRPGAKKRRTQPQSKGVRR